MPTRAELLNCLIDGELQGKDEEGLLNELLDSPQQRAQLAGLQLIKYLVQTAYAGVKVPSGACDTPQNMRRTQRKR